MKQTVISLAVTGFLLSGCSSAPLRFYTLGAPAIEGASLPLRANTPVLTVDPVLIPDYLDNQDMIIRKGGLLDRSPNSRWASRLSRGITDLMTAQLSQAKPSIFITSHPSTATPATRLSVVITRLDITSEGHGTLEADWSFIPSEEQKPIVRHRAVFSTQGQSTTDAGNAALTHSLVEQLSTAISASAPVF